MKYKRIFVIVMDSVGIGAMKDAKEYNDEGTNTFVHTAEKCGGLNIPTLNKLGIGDLAPIKGTSIVKHPNSYSLVLNEASKGKDTMTGHWEMMGVLTTKPFKTFTSTGFPKQLIDELEQKTGHKFIGNYSSSGTEILVELGEEHLKTGALIVYTSADSVLQIAAHEEKIGLEELYRCCEIAREICNRSDYMLGRIIARPFLGDNKSNFKRTPNRHDYALSPSGITALDILKEHNYEVSCIGKIYDIFNTKGATRTQKTISNIDGMNKTIQEAIEKDYQGICFVNLVEFDSEYGHRRNPFGYGKAIEEFDAQLKQLIEVLRDDDLLLITADHGNDPTYIGTDHTRESVPLICYSKQIKDGRQLESRLSFADIGATILENFNLKKDPSMIGEVITELIK